MRSSAKHTISPEMNRVKVAIRCRPAFRAEIEGTNGEKFIGVVNTVNDQSGIGRVTLNHATQALSKSRDFIFDYAFGADYDQGAIFQAIAEPVVDDFLSGRNGTLFAYGQTGTGKTYTMGVLEFVNDEHAGIIPRTISRIFDYADHEMVSNNAIVKVTLSFLQLYRETIQDLLAPLATSPATAGLKSVTTSETNLAIREDPLRGFYVDGLQEFEVSDYAEAEMLVNMGLENRAIASTLMNTTSSRSHTILTLYIETQQRRGGQHEHQNYGRSVRSKLMLVDLAGSERVRRSVSTGARLAEAKSINSSLSALGNVISGLAGLSLDAVYGHTHTHIPFRDSKLTKLLQDSLGGSSSTALIATVGPAAANYGETLSTLQFAARCMSVRGLQVEQNVSDVDYASECLGLREEVSILEEELHRQQQIAAAQSKIYDAAIRQLYTDLASSRKGSGKPHTPAWGQRDGDREWEGEELFDFKKLESLIDHLSAAAEKTEKIPLVAPSSVAPSPLVAPSPVGLQPAAVRTVPNPAPSPLTVVTASVGRFLVPAPSVCDDVDIEQAGKAVSSGAAFSDVAPPPRIRKASGQIDVVVTDRPSPFTQHPITVEGPCPPSHRTTSVEDINLPSPAEASSGLSSVPCVPESVLIRHMELSSMQQEDLKRKRTSLPLAQVYPFRLAPPILLTKASSDSCVDSDDTATASAESHSGPKQGCAHQHHPVTHDRRDSEGGYPRAIRGDGPGSSTRDPSKGQSPVPHAPLHPHPHPEPAGKGQSFRGHRAASSGTDVSCRAPCQSEGVDRRDLDRSRDRGRSGRGAIEVGGHRSAQCDVSSVVDQIGSLSAAQLSILSPEMREQVIAIKRLLDSGVDPLRGGQNQTGLSEQISSSVDANNTYHTHSQIADSGVSDVTGRRRGSGSRPSHWQHRYRNYSEPDSESLSDQEQGQEVDGEWREDRETLI